VWGTFDDDKDNDNGNDSDDDDCGSDFIDNALGVR